MDGGGDHLPELLSHCIHHVPGGQLGLSQHPIPASFHLQLTHVHTYISVPVLTVPEAFWGVVYGHIVI